MALAALHTPRLTLISATLAMLDADLAGADALAAAIGARVPPGWPPGEHDVDAVRFFRERLVADGDAAAGWLAWYAVRRADATTPATLVGACGYLGPPADGGVEIGYSVVESYRGQGLAGEMVEALVARAFADARVVVVLAETTPDNAASRAVLVRHGFRVVGAGRGEGSLRYQRPRMD